MQSNAELVMAAYQRRFGGLSTNVACSMISGTMDKGSNPQTHDEPLAPPNSNLSGNNNKDHEESNQRPQYTIPGIVHFIQHEWARFEMERAQWEVERAELQAKIAYLQGERKGQENLKTDLVRRIKMLEFALKQERAKYHKLKYGTDLQQGDMKPPSFEEGPQMEGMDADAFIPPNTNVSWKQGRQLLRQYLQEIGYTDTIIDVRSTRVRSLLGVGNNENEENHNLVSSMNGSDSNKRSESQNKRPAIKKGPNHSIVEGMLMDTEAAVMANFEFLSTEHIGVGDMDEDDNIRIDGEEDDDNGQLENNRRNSNWNKMVLNDGIDDVDAETEDVMAEFHFLHSTENDTIDSRNASDGYALQGGGFTSGSSARKQIVGGNNDDDVMDGNLESGLVLGELAQLTVNNDADMSYDSSSSKEAFRKTWNAKYSLRSHFDGVRALAFHPVEPVLITASEDHTLKLWNLQKTVPAKKSASFDVEPVYTFRAHTGPVLCLALSNTGEQCFSGGLDSTIFCWTVPSPSIDPYDTFDSSVVSERLTGHQDAVWGLALHHTKSQLLSCSSDGTVKLWSPGSKQPLLSSYTFEKDGTPTSIDYVRCDPSSSMIVSAYTSGNCVLLDLETGKPVLRLEGGQEESEYHQINCVVSHPTLPLTITAHEDRNIRFYDNTSGRMVHSMIAHLDAVTSLAIDPNGLYLLSGSHDCSIRLWNLDTKACVQEITSHRKKFDESIFDVAFHPSKPYIASAGADGLAKVFV